MPLENKPRTGPAIWIIIITAVVLFGSATALLWNFPDPARNLAAEFRWALIPIICAACLALLMLVYTTVFAMLNLTDKAQAMALPDGSVRSVIALILLATFIIVPIFLYNGLDTGQSEKTMENVDSKSLNYFQTNPKVQFIGSTLTTPPTMSNATPPVETSPARYTVRYLDVVGTEKNDFAKMLLTAIITLVSAVSSFFFGAATVKSAQSSSISQASSLLQANKPTVNADNGLKGIPGTQQISLSWSPVSGATAYNVYRSSSSGVAIGPTPNHTLVATTFTDTGLVSGTAYWYQVTAVTPTGVVSPFSEISVTAL